MIYSDDFIIAFKCLTKLILVVIASPVIVIIILYRIAKGKSNKWLMNWIWS